MLSTSLKTRIFFSSAIAVAALSQPSTARACGGCFHETNAPTENASVVTDHRMALSISQTQTVLWDQVRYQGNPKEFAWVLPVGQGARVELARDEWLGALDALTAPQISAPAVNCPGTGGGYGGGGGGCGAASNAPGLSYDSDAGAYGSSDGGFQGGGGVNVVSQSVVGPYLAVTIHSSDGEAISKWLVDNGFAIPTSIQPVLDAYTKDGFDFLALRLAPNVGVQAMQPVRVVTPGASPTLPLRMVAAGIGDSVGLDLYVVSEGRYQATNFADLVVDRSQIQWDPTLNRSTYTTQFASLVASKPGWVTEFSANVPTLSQTYKSVCINQPDVAVPCDPVTTPDAGADAAADDASTNATDAATDDAATEDAGTDAAQADAQVDDAESGDAQADGGTDPDADVDAQADAAPTATDGGSCVKYVSACSLFTDYDTATSGLSTYDIRVTRLRTTLPASALGVDLQIGASPDQSTISNRMTATGYTVPGYNPCPAPTPAPDYKEGCGCSTVGAHRYTMPTSLGFLALYALARRRRRPRGDR